MWSNSIHQEIQELFEPLPVADLQSSLTSFSKLAPAIRANDFARETEFCRHKFATIIGSYKPATDKAGYMRAWRTANRKHVNNYKRAWRLKVKARRLAQVAQIEKVACSQDSAA